VRRRSVDPAFTFAVSLVLSLVLCAPTFMNRFHGAVDVTEGGIRYLVALAISWCGVHGVATLVPATPARRRALRGRHGRHGRRRSPNRNDVTTTSMHPPADVA
jgi:hypothetical protein